MPPHLGRGPALSSWPQRCAAPHPHHARSHLFLRALGAQRQPSDTRQATIHFLMPRTWHGTHGTQERWPPLSSWPWRCMAPHPHWGGPAPFFMALVLHGNHSHIEGAGGAPLPSWPWRCHSRERVVPSLHGHDMVWQPNHIREGATPLIATALHVIQSHIGHRADLFFTGLVHSLNARGRWPDPRQMSVLTTGGVPEQPYVVVQVHLLIPYRGGGCRCVRWEWGGGQVAKALGSWRAWSVPAPCRLRPYPA